MAAVTLSDCHSLIKKRGFLTLQEPTCGSGVMIIEAYNYLREEDFNPQQQMWAQARDLDFTAALMCYIQMTLLHIPGEVIIGELPFIHTCSHNGKLEQKIGECRFLY